MTPPLDPPPAYDVQSALSALADHPAVLRRLGVIRVIEVDLAGTALSPAGAGDVTITATPSWSTKLPAPQVQVAPVTAPAHLSASRFAVSADGRVDPSAAKIDVVEVDTEGAVLGLLNLAHTVSHGDTANAAPKVPGQPPVTLPQNTSLPALRNAGLALVQADRSVDLRARLVANVPTLTVSGAGAADARQLLKGILLDVWDDRTRRWHTLCARRGRYRLPGGTVLTLDDEGSISLAATTRPDGDAASALYLHQSVARWTGWSLVAPRPGTPVETEFPGNAPAAPKDALPGYHVTFAAKPGTLPLLRFGVTYRFQLRTVDLAGHADPLPAPSDFGRATEPVRYLRFEPIPSPYLLPDAPLTEGESTETLVLRSGPKALGKVNSLLSEPTTTPPTRHVAPPKATQMLCEEHGRFDRKGVPDPRLYREIAARDAVDLGKIGVPDPNRPSGDPARPGARYLRSALAVSWLPDPAAFGAALNGLSTDPVRVRFAASSSGSAWPDVRSFRLHLVEGDGAPAWDAGSRNLRVALPRGFTRTARLSCFPSDRDAQLFGQLAWLAASGAPAAEQAAARGDVLAGRAWQVTPWRVLTFVNAVRKPVTAPKFAAPLTAARNADDAKAELSGTANIHLPSTARLCLEARWTELVDDPSAPAPVDLPARATPMELTLDYGDDPPVRDVPFAATHIFGDTKRRKVAYVLVGHTRYMEHFTQRGIVRLTGTEPLGLSSAGIVPGTDTVRSADRATTYRRGVDYRVDEEGGTIARLPGGAIADRQRVEVAIVPPPVSSGSAPSAVDVPSTARPHPPRVAWIVPTFGWAAGTGDKGLTRSRTRSGGGLRIFLERPWWTSGVGEQLAVVLADTPLTTGPAHAVARDLVTRLGRDPIFSAPAGSEAPTEYPAPEDFPLATARTRGLVPADDPAVSPFVVSVAGHDVVWDAQRRRWAVDVVLPPGRTYTPFVRLVLARYQPNSVGTLHLSRAALVEWAQLGPDRTATVKLEAKDQAAVALTVAGLSPAGTAATAGPNLVTVVVQKGTRSSPGELDWQTVGSAEGTALTAAVQPDGTTTWSVKLRLPTARWRAPYRLVITEWERIGAGRRLVYSDAVRI